MATDEEAKKAQIVESRARNISHNVRCTECGSQSIEDSNADVAVLLRKVLRLNWNISELCIVNICYLYSVEYGELKSCDITNLKNILCTSKN
jgi:Cytochrome C biogenesis protein